MTDGPILLARGLDLAAGSSGPRLVTYNWPAPFGNAASLLGLWPAQPVLAHGALLGIGAAAELRVDGLDAATAKRWAERVFEDLGSHDAPPILCGSAFSPASVGQGRWRAFPGFQAMLPRWTYARDAKGAALWFTAPAASLRGPVPRQQIAQELAQLTACLATAPDARAASLEPAVQMPPARWERLVQEALDGIKNGRFHKLVVARSAILRASESTSAAEVFGRLQAAEGCTPFAARLGEATFLGATPERLVGLSQGRFNVDALAGTAANAGGAAGLLLHDAKNREEHRLVVDEIQRRLHPLSVELAVPAEPRLRRLEDLTHLHTPIAGRVAAGVHLLDLACALHPTPAVAGLPALEAVEWILAHEPEPRGWYAGFIGWFDRSGDGELSVAIRSGLLAGREACLYTGAGIVIGSEPAAEYRETAWKQRPFLRALGVELPA